MEALFAVGVMAAFFAGVGMSEARWHSKAAHFATRLGQIAAVLELADRAGGLTDEGKGRYAMLGEVLPIMKEEL